MKINTLKIIALTLLVIGCGDKLKEVPTDKFVGVWELKGRGVFEGIQIKIESQGEKLTGCLRTMVILGSLKSQDLQTINSG